MYFQQKNVFCILGARWHKNSWICRIISYLWMVGLVMRLFSCGANLSPAPRPLQVTFLVVKLNICGCRTFSRTHVISKKNGVLNFGRALTQNYWICPIISYLWMVGLVMRLFSCGANLWRSSACIQPKNHHIPNYLRVCKIMFCIVGARWHKIRCFRAYRNFTTTQIKSRVNNFLGCKDHNFSK